MYGEMPPRMALDIIRTHMETHIEGARRVSAPFRAALLSACIALALRIPLDPMREPCVKHANCDVLVTYCPNCLRFIVTRVPAVPNFCTHCGQAIRIDRKAVKSERDDT